MLLSIPGPSSSCKGASVDSTGSPTNSPEVSSYTCTNAVSPSSRMISPISFSRPTRTMSYMRAPARPWAITAGPEMRVISPTTAMGPSSPRNATPSSLELHVESDVLFHEAGDVRLPALHLHPGRRQRHDDRQIPAAQEPGARLVGAGEQVLVHRDDAVPRRDARLELFEGTGGRVRLAHFHPGETEPRRRLAVGDHRHLIHSRAPGARRPRECRVGARARRRAGC